MKQPGSAPLLFSSSLSNHNLQTHTSKSKTQHSHPDTTHANTPDTTDSSTAPGRHTTPPTSITRDGNSPGNKPSSKTSNVKVQTQNSQGQPLYFFHRLSPITTCKHTPPRARHNTHILTSPTETHQKQQSPVPHQGDTQHRPQAFQEMKTDTDTNHPGPTRNIQGVNIKQPGRVFSSVST